MKIIEIPDVVGDNYQHKIEALVSSLNWKWCYLPDVTFCENKDKEIPGFSHLLYDIQTNYESSELSFFYPLALEIASKVNEKVFNFIRMKVNLLLPGNLGPNNKHVDFDFKHTTAIYYVSDSDGDTVFYNGDEEILRCTPQKGKAVVFDGSIVHASSCPINYNRRMVINLNYINEEH
jgi:hypothetical protein